MTCDAITKWLAMTITGAMGGTAGYVLNRAFDAHA